MMIKIADIEVIDAQGNVTEAGNRLRKMITQGNPLYKTSQLRVKDLEDVARNITVECKECAGRGYGTPDCCTIPDRANREDCVECKDCHGCDICDTTGKLSILKAWEANHAR